MTSKHLTTLFLLALIAMAIPARGQEGTTRLAIANPSKILAEMQETKELNNKQNDERKKLEEERQQRVGELQKLQKDRDDFVSRGTPEWEEKTQQLEEKAADLKKWGDLKQRQLERHYKEQIRTLFTRILGAVHDVASLKKIDLVIADYGQEIPVDLEQLTPEQLHGLIRNQNILYSEKPADITSDVITLLDARFKGGK